jgi:putative FmdB family regulatory protein
MPTYEYRCEDCGRIFETIEHIDEHGRARPQCPDCEGAKVEQVMSPFYARTGKKS